MTMTSQARRGPINPFFCSLASRYIVCVDHCGLIDCKFRISGRASHGRCSLSHSDATQRRDRRRLAFVEMKFDERCTSLQRVCDSLSVAIKSVIYARCWMFGYRHRNRIVSLSFERQRVYAMFSLYRHGLWLIQLVRVCALEKARL